MEQGEHIVGTLCRLRNSFKMKVKMRSARNSKKRAAKDHNVNNVSDEKATLCGGGGGDGGSISDVCTTHSGQAWSLPNTLPVIPTYTDCPAPPLAPSDCCESASVPPGLGDGESGGGVGFLGATEPVNVSPAPSLLSQCSTSTDSKVVLNKQGYVEEEEKEYVPGIHVRAAPLHKLAALAVDCFTADGELSGRSDFPAVLFLMHQWFCTSEQLCHQYIDLYNDCDSQICCAVSNCQHLLSCSECAMSQYKSRICYTVRYWIQTFPVHFDSNRKLSQIVSELQNAIWMQDPDSPLAALIDISKVPSYEWIRNLSVHEPNTLHSSKKVSLVFDNIKPDELAEQLTFLEFKAFRRITFGDFKHYAVQGGLRENPRLERSVALFNGLSQWVQCMVLSKTTPQQRASIIVKFINVAKRLRQLRNFNTLMAVVGGLTHSSLARLNKTNQCIPSQSQKVLMEYSELLSSNNNFSNYRRVLQQTAGFRIPILGVHLKDLVLSNTALPDKLDTHLINFRKMAQMSNIFRELMCVQNASSPVQGNLDLVNTIRLSLDLHYTEDEIYELSLAREPRSSLSAPSTPTKPVQFSDWVSGVSPPDPDTINKHVHDMVEAVFKNYDHDRDGFISHEEFESIAGNFPFIDSFCVLDADKDGMISKAEMKTYFIRANCHAMKKCFKHNFHETTYFKPTFCIHCTGLLWGLIKQGWKCKDCQINAHKHCKDLVVMECRSVRSSHGSSSSHTSLHGRSHSVPAVTNGSAAHHDVTIARKRKILQHHKRSRRAASTQTETGSLDSNSTCALLPVRSMSEPCDTLLLSPKHGRCLSVDCDRVRTESLDSTDTNLDSDRPCSSTADIGEFYEDPVVLYERMSRADEERDELINENQALRTRLTSQQEQISTLHRHIGIIRQHTISFILDQMDTLHIQRDTEV